ncbi:MAG: fibronectin type III domain-containing protein [Limisphaerales bacterium]
MALQGELKAAMADRDAAETDFDAGTTQLALYVENTSGGDAVKIASAGMSIKAAPTPVGPLEQVQNLSITASDEEGGLDLQWEPVRGAKNYEIQTSTDPNVPANWRLVDTSSSSKVSLEDLTSGQKIWARVRAKAPKKVNDGAWSDPATKIVP